MQGRVRAYAEKYHMIEPGGRTVAGVSGGPDSVCLLFLLKDLCGEKKNELSAVHVHHGLRGKEADGDETFVRELCRQLKIPLTVYSFDVRRRAEEEKLTLEEAGRLCRYEAFQKEAERLGGARIAVAHHEDDQAETVLFHLFRGTGLRGLCGMEPVRGNIIRPLLGVSREEILDWLKKREIPWRTDSTNEETEYTRNKLRREIFPLVHTEINPRASVHVAELAEELSQTERYLERQTEEAFAACVTVQDGEILADREKLLGLDPVIAARTVRRMMECMGGLKDIDRVHIRLILEIAKKQTGRKIDLPGGIQAGREYGWLRLSKKTSDGRGCAEAKAEGEKKEEKKEERKEEEALRPEIPGTLCIGTQKWNFELESAQKDQNIPEKTYTKWFDYDKIKRYLEIRRKKPGDYLEINKEHGRKKLKAYFRDEKIPAAQRESLHLLADGDHILWVPGHRISEGYKVTAETTRILKVQIDGGEDDG